MKAAIALACAMAALASAQTFEAASVTVNRSGRNPGSSGRSGGQLVFENTSLRECIAIAYGTGVDRDYAISGPAWIGSERYDIVAKVPAETPRAQVLIMLQALLAERFHLRVHRETREMRVYRLVVSRTGPKLKTVPASEGGFTFRPGHVSCRAETMEDFAGKLSRPVFGLGVPVIDATHLTAAYDFTLDWTPDNVQPEPAPGPSLFSALEEQLGLKLVAGRGQIEVLVIDQADRVPTAN